MEYRVFKEYNIVYCQSAIKTPVGRIAWPHLTKQVEPRPDKDGKIVGQPKFDVTLYLDKSDPAVEAFVDELEEIADGLVDKYNEGASAEVKGVKRVLRDGDLSDHEKYPQEKGMWMLTANNKNCPDIFDTNKAGIEAESVKAGMFGRLVVVPRFGGKGMAYQVEIVQVTGDDGVRFSGGASDYSSLLDDVKGGSSDEPEEKEAKENVPQSPKTTAPRITAADRAKAAAEQMAKESKGTGKVAGKGKQQAVSLL